jgi:hypothetical protein
MKKGSIKPDPSIKMGKGFTGMHITIEPISERIDANESGLCGLII